MNLNPYSPHGGKPFNVENADRSTKEPEKVLSRQQRRFIRRRAVKTVAQQMKKMKMKDK